MSNLASNLVGHVINDWRVEKKLSKVDGTGGCFSSGYIVKHSDGRTAFLKAINIGYAIKARGKNKSRTTLLKEITEEFEHEKSLLAICDANGLDRVVKTLETGEYEHDSDTVFVPYLVFELCKEGDVRRHPKMQQPMLAWRLRVFHGVCVGLLQLHRNDIYHQDLKPSNVLISTGDVPKIADLGRATTSSPTALYSEPEHWGDPGYVPVEFMYKFFLPDADIRRKAADFYMLGGIFAYLISSVNFFSEILAKIPSAYHPNRWRGSEYADVLPILQGATSELVNEIVANTPRPLQNDVRELLSWLTNPDPSKRGHPRTIQQVSGDRFSLERVVTQANLVANRAKLAR